MEQLKAQLENKFAVKDHGEAKKKKKKSGMKIEIE